MNAIIVIEEAREITADEFLRIIARAMATGQTVIVHLPMKEPEPPSVDMVAAAFAQANESIKQIAELKGIAMEDLQYKVIESLPVDPQDYNYQSNKLPPNWKTFTNVRPKVFHRRIDSRGRKPFRKVM